MARYNINGKSVEANNLKEARAKTAPKKVAKKQKKEDT